MILNLESGSYNIKNNINQQVYSTMHFSGNFKGCSLNFMLLSLTKNTMRVGVQLQSVDMLNQARAVEVYIPLFDGFNGATQQEQQAFIQFGVNAFKYEFICLIKDIKSVRNNMYNYEISLNIKESKKSYWKI